MRNSSSRNSVGGTKSWQKSSFERVDKEFGSRKRSLNINNSPSKAWTTIQLREDVVKKSTTEDDPVTEDLALGMSEDGSEERETAYKMWLSEKITSRETENVESKKALLVMEARIAFKENARRQASERRFVTEAAIRQIAEMHNTKTASSRNQEPWSKALLMKIINRNNFQNVGIIMQIHEQYIVRSGVITQEMMQYINPPVQDNQNKNLRIGSLTKEMLVHTEIFGQHLKGQQVITEVMKVMMAGHHQGQQQSQPQGVSGTSPIVTEVDDDGTDPNFSSALSPHEGPPSGGIWGAVSVPIQVPLSMEIVSQF